MACGPRPSWPFSLILSGFRTFTSPSAAPAGGRLPFRRAFHGGFGALVGLLVPAEDSTWLRPPASLCELPPSPELLRTGRKAERRKPRDWSDSFPLARARGEPRALPPSLLELWRSRCRAGRGSLCESVAPLLTWLNDKDNAVSVRVKDRVRFQSSLRDSVDSLVGSQGLPVAFAPAAPWAIINCPCGAEDDIHRSVRRAKCVVRSRECV